MRRCVIFLLAAFSILPCFGSKILNLDMTQNPESIVIYDTKVFIQDQKSVQLYSLKEKKFLKFVGSHGMGPGDYNQLIDISWLTLDNKLLVLSLNKISLFDLNGQYLSERRLNKYIKKIAPFGDGFIIKGFSVDLSNKDYINDISLTDTHFNPIKKLYRVINPNPLRRINVIYFYEGFAVYKGMVFISTSKNRGILFKVFNKNGVGTKSFFINDNHTRIPDSVIKKMKNKIRVEKKAYWHLLKDTLYFPDYYPPIKDFTIDSDNIFIKTWITEKKRCKFKVTDLSGKVKRKTYLPDAGKLYFIRGDDYYYIVENEETGDWELHSVKH